MKEEGIPRVRITSDPSLRAVVDIVAGYAGGRVRGGAGVEGSSSSYR